MTCFTDKGKRKAPPTIIATPPFPLPSPPLPKSKLVPQSEAGAWPRPLSSFERVMGQGLLAIATHGPRELREIRPRLIPRRVDPRLVPRPRHLDVRHLGVRHRPGGEHVSTLHAGSLGLVRRHAVAQPHVVALVRGQRHGETLAAIEPHRDRLAPALSLRPAVG